MPRWAEPFLKPLDDQAQRTFNHPISFFARSSIATAYLVSAVSFDP